jgi:GNAT superfamily N-acetyltransferase
MARPARSSARSLWHRIARGGLAALPRSTRFALFRALVDCDPAPDARLTLKVAETQAELEACFALLHDAYVAHGFMAPQPSGLRVTLYHALPTTTTLCAKWDGEVVGTMSLIRDGVFGFPLQSVFDLTRVRAQTGQIAEVSALAVHPRFRRTGGAVLFPLMKFMYEYCTGYFDTRHLVIAVHPNRIELYESLLFFERLAAQVVDNYDFANGAPAVGATLDLHAAPARMQAAFGGKPRRKDLHRYFTRLRLPNIQPPPRRYYTTNDPVMTPAMLDHFFNLRTRTFDRMDARQRLLLHTIYDLPAYRDVLPPVPAASPEVLPHIREHQRYSMKCPGTLEMPGQDDGPCELEVVELSLNGFQASASRPVPLETWGIAQIRLGDADSAVLRVAAVREHDIDGEAFYGFRIIEGADDSWAICVDALRRGQTSGDLTEPMPL